ncbi:MAG: 50S ribosomal protein L25 [Gemmatimonadetes bacterium]|nr:50S ribosomal protein L25 [Gemmatimonadota bacterium]
MAATLNATARTGSGKGGARKLRATGKVPAVVYGHGDKNVPLALDRHELELLLHAISVEYTVISLVTDGGAGKDVLIRDVQMHPYRPEVLHVDFIQLHAGEVIRMKIPVRLSGNPAGVRDEGAVLDQVIYDLEVECLPGNIPEAFDVDVSALEVGESVRVHDVSIPNVRVLADGELPIASVVAPSTGPAGDAETASGEPEVLTAKAAQNT